MSMSAGQDMSPFSLGEKSAHVGKRGRKIKVIAINPCQDVSGGAGKTLVDGIRLATVLLTHPICKPRPVFPYDFDGVIRATSVYDDVFKVRIALEKD